MSDIGIVTVDSAALATVLRCVKDLNLSADEARAVCNLQSVLDEGAPRRDLIERMWRAYGREFYGEHWPSTFPHDDQRDAMSAALDVVIEALDADDWNAGEYLRSIR